ncbi:hypothetical protein HWB80_gp113 [Streptomyces phage Karimac]|uniref:Uncharacterized protein n=1 Tax=Streptomyces phage Karimac TaxID=2283303 RepID=A0A345MHJ7_9CAUD|nr:hypothetical protein HWB80_gp113 [Streptomyces phage Karimac]AXH70028.1 hypothetical protein SEA_KARIMAC_206 [Streptomyces phage Karimac]QDF17333.1 hypothetical protein SEA_BIRCHLYN_204 [Streptomyces phage Birchlyn]WPH58577.1 hypothetical protein SEA_SPELLY_209 [Streptomyces phage Spelly]
MTEFIAKHPVAYAVAFFVLGFIIG